MPALYERLPASGVLSHAGLMPIVTSDVDVGPVPIVTLDAQVPPAASRVTVSKAGLVGDVLASVPLVPQAFPSGSVSLPHASREAALGYVASPVVTDNALSAPVGLPALYQTSVLTAKAEFLRHGRSAPVAVPGWWPLYLAFFEEIVESAEAACPTDPDLLVFLGVDVAKLMVEWDVSKDRVIKLLERRREAESTLVQLVAKLRAEEGIYCTYEGLSLKADKRATQAVEEIRK